MPKTLRYSWTPEREASSLRSRAGLQDPFFRVIRAVGGQLGFVVSILRLSIFFVC